MVARMAQTGQSLRGGNAPQPLAPPRFLSYSELDGIAGTVAYPESFMPQPDSFMAIETNDQLLTVLHRTGIFEPDQLAEIRLQLLAHYADPVALGEYLVEIGIECQSMRGDSRHLSDWDRALG